MQQNVTGTVSSPPVGIFYMPLSSAATAPATPAAAAPSAATPPSAAAIPTTAPTAADLPAPARARPSVSRACSLTRPRDRPQRHRVHRYPYFGLWHELACRWMIATFPPMFIPKGATRGATA